MKMTPHFYNQTESLVTLDIKGERFVVLKKEYLDELLVLFRSFLGGENLLKNGSEKFFSDFLKSTRKIKSGRSR